MFFRKAECALALQVRYKNSSLIALFDLTVPLKVVTYTVAFRDFITLVYYV